METIRIPTRYKKMISRLSHEEKAWILDCLFDLAEGNDAVVKDSFAGDTLEQIWRDCVMMEKKNKHNAEYIGGVCTSPEAHSVVNASYEETTTGYERKGKEEKRSEKKVKGENIIISSKEETATAEYVPKEITKKIDDVLKGLKAVIGLDDFKETGQVKRNYGKHFVSLLEKIGKEEFRKRLEGILSDNFKQKNCNSLKYLYGEMKSFIHSPVVETRDEKRYSKTYSFDM